MKLYFDNNQDKKISKFNLKLKKRIQCTYMNKGSDAV